MSSVDDLLAQEKNFRHTLGFWSLTATSFGGIVGSGWLFSALYGAQIAGPASLVSWVIAGAAVALVSLVLIELGASRPEAGGSVRWPLYANGRVVGTTFGWTVILGLISDTEVLAVTQYLSYYWPWLYSGKSLSLAGIGAAALLQAVIVAVNWYGIALVARLNLVLTWLKLLVPTVTIIALFASGFHAGNIAAGGGFAPYGWGAVLSAVSTGGLVYAVNGFQPPVDLSGEARNPRRDIPRAILTAIGLSVLVYLLLQLAFLGAVPHGLLARAGWKGIDFTSPFGELALLLNLGWLSSLLYVDAVLSPAGSNLVGITEGARQTYALAKSRVLPKYFLSVPESHGVPRRALLLNFVLGLLVLIPLHSWISLVSVIGDVFVFTYAVSAIAAGTFRSAEPTRLSGWIPGIRWIAPASFVISTLIAYWSTWQDLRVAFPLALVGIVVFLFTRDRDRDRPLGADLKSGAWLVAYIGFLVLLSGIGSYGGAGWIGQPWDSVIAAAGAAGVYAWAVRAGRAHVTAAAEAEAADSPAVSDLLSAVAAGSDVPGLVPAQAGVSQPRTAAEGDGG